MYVTPANLPAWANVVHYYLIMSRQFWSNRHFPAGDSAWHFHWLMTCWRYCTGTSLKQARPPDNHWTKIQYSRRQKKIIATVSLLRGTGAGQKHQRPKPNRRIFYNFKAN